IVLIGLASWGLASALTEQQYIDLGKAEFHRGNYDAAIYLFTNGLEVNPDNQWLYNDRGLCYVEKGDRDMAIDEFSKAIEVEPDFAGAYYNRGLTYFEARGYENAIADYTKAIELLDDPDNIDAYYNRGLAYNKLYHPYSKPFTPEHNESYKKALADFDKVLELDPEYALAHAAKGGALYRYGEFENAAAEFDIAVNVNSRDWILRKSGGIGLAGVYKSRGRNYRQIPDYDKSIENYNMAMNYNPIPDGHQVSNYKDVGEWNKAIEIADRIIELRKDDSTFRTSSYGEYYYTAAIGDCYCHLGEYDKAMEMYDKAYEKCLLNTPDSLYKVYQARGDCYYEFEQYDKAMEMYTKVVAEYIKNRPNRVYDIYSKVGDVHLALGEYDKAMEMYNKA
ncbi:MAG: tetratricopeptide repeat protein, partial [Methanophagales archaeon]|nr:tetratricopeptide repeat protein [Methanophagales archaeon]